MKKILVTVLSFLLAFSVIACGGRQSSSGSGGSVSGTQKYTGLPFAKDGKTTLSLIMNGYHSPTLSSYDYKDNTFTQKVVKDTGIMLEIIDITGPDANERLNIMLSSNNYTDVITKGTSVNDLNYWVSQGILQPLDGFNPLLYPNIKALLETYPYVYEKIRGSDGKMYALPDIQECLHCLYGNRTFYHMPWVRDNYGNKTPDTLDEFVAYLRYIQNNDINGNGNKNDEIPMAVDKNNAGTFINYFAGSFLPWVTGDWGAGIANIDGTVVDQTKDPAFRDTLRFLNGLYKEGLLAPNSFTMTADELKSLLQAEPPIVGVYSAGWKTAYLSTGSLRMIESFSLKPLTGPNGVKYATHGSSASNASAHWMVTDKAKDPELAVALYDYLIDFEINNDGSLGAKGVVWDYPETGAKGMNGGPALYRLLANQSGNKPLNGWWDKGIPVIYTGSWFAGVQTTGIEEAQKWHESGDPSVENYLNQNPDYVELMWNMIAREHEKYAVPDTYYVPAAILSEDDNIRLSDINASLDTYKSQVYVEFITGVKNIDRDADWNDFIAELDRYGAAEKVSIVQKYNSK